jgi:hypothetical protein
MCGMTGRWQNRRHEYLCDRLRTDGRVTDLAKYGSERRAECAHLPKSALGYEQASTASAARYSMHRVHPAGSVKLVEIR